MGVDLVLDDYHLADGDAIAADVAFLLEHLPPQVHLVISTRADPALPLARLRARGELVEVRAADLRFTLDEVAAYLNDVVGSRSRRPRDSRRSRDAPRGGSPRSQLAALSLQGREDAAGFIAGFAGDDRYVVDYLVEEVLGRQPETVRSLPARHLGPRPAERAALRRRHRRRRRQGRARVARALEPVRRPPRRQSPVVPLPPPVRRCPARASPATSGPTTSPDCTGGRPTGTPRQASRCPPSGTRSRPGDVEQAADLIERSLIGVLLRERQETTARRWVDDVPDDVVRRRPVLAVGFIGALMSSGDLRWYAERARRRWSRCWPRPAGRRGRARRGRARAAARARSRPTGPRSPSSPATPPAPSRTPTWPSSAPRPATTSPSPPRRRSRAWPGGGRRPGGRAPRLLGRRRRARARRQHLRRPRLLDHPRRPPDHPGSTRRRPATYEDALGWPRPTRSTSLCAGRPTCSSA